MVCLVDIVTAYTAHPTPLMTLLSDLKACLPLLEIEVQSLTSDFSLLDSDTSTVSTAAAVAAVAVYSLS
jgi:hypothetical protein